MSESVLEIGPDIKPEGNEAELKRQYAIAKEMLSGAQDVVLRARLEKQTAALRAEILQLDPHFSE